MLKHYISKCLQLSETTFLEIELSKSENFWSYISFSFAWTTRVDHAGFRLDFCVWKFSFDFNIYDCRHWDVKNNCWFEKGKDLSKDYITECAENHGERK